MAGRNKEPVDLLLAKGKTHLTQAEIDRRRAEEVNAPDDSVAPPSYLTKKQRDEFDKIASELVALKIMKNLDCDALAGYIVARDSWVSAGKKLRTKECKASVLLFDAWAKIEDRYRRQMRAAASDLGLTITSRGKLVMPKAPDATPKKNKFAVFAGGGSG